MNLRLWVSVRAAGEAIGRHVDKKHAISPLSTRPPGEELEPRHRHGRGLDGPTHRATTATPSVACKAGCRPPARGDEYGAREISGRSRSSAPASGWRREKCHHVDNRTASSRRSNIVLRLSLTKRTSRRPFMRASAAWFSTILAACGRRQSKSIACLLFASSAAEGFARRRHQRSSHQAATKKSIGAIANADVSSMIPDAQRIASMAGTAESLHLFD